MAMSSKKWQKPRVVFQPEVHQGLLRGIGQIVDAVRPTLGPLPRVVLYDKTVGVTSRVPEFLDDGGTIARRIIEIRGRDADVGAMLARNLLWTVREEVGDGTATAAVLYKSVYEEGVRYLTSGGNAMRLRMYLEYALREIIHELGGMTTRVEGKKELGKLATATANDPEMGDLLGEIFDVVGEFGRLEIRKNRGRGYEREYVEGMYWDGGLVSRAFITNLDRQRAELQNTAVLITDLDIEEPRELIPVLSTCVQAGIEDVAIIARKISDVVVGMLMMNHEKGKVKIHAIAVKAPGKSDTEQQMALTDMAILTGGKPFFRAAGDTIREIKLSDLGRTRRLWADILNLGIVGGQGDPRALRAHIAKLRAAYPTAEAEDRKSLQQRIGKLMGGSATLYVGGTTETELEYNKEQAQRAADAMRGAMREGVVPGGGAALLACQPVLAARMAESEDLDQRAAYRILMIAMEAPMRALLQNAGFEPGEVLGSVVKAGPGYGFDVVRGQLVDMREAGIQDITTVTKAAVRGAVSAAAMALTTDVLIHRAQAPEATKP